MEEKIAFYCRVSTEKQKDENTIEKQLYNLKNIYKQRNVVAQYLDDGFSGSFENRPALLRIKNDAQLGVYNVLAIDVLDRSTRGGAKMLEPLFDHLISYGIRIEIGGIPVDYKTPEGKFSNNVQAEAVRLAKEIIIRNMINGKYAKADKKILIGCYPSWGYKLIKRDRENKIEAHFEIDPISSVKIKKCFEVYRKEQNLNRAVKKLAENGVYARGKKGEEGKYQVPILPGTLKQILKNESYIGNFYFGKKQYCKATRIVKEISKTRDRGLFTGWKWRPRGEWKHIKIPAIIDENTFYTVQDILKKRSENFIRTPKYNYLLQKLIKCTVCGRYYRCKPCGHPFKKKDGTISRYFEYLCYTKQEHKRCSSRVINARILEGAVWSMVQLYMNKPEDLKKAIEQSKKEKSFDKNKYERELRALISKRENIHKRVSNLLDLYGDDKIDKSDLDDKIETLNSDKKLIDSQIQEARNIIKDIETSSRDEEEIKKTCEMYSSDIKRSDLTFEYKKMVIRDWVKEINITDKLEIIIKMRVPRVGDSVFKSSDNVYALWKLNTDKTRLNLATVARFNLVLTSFIFMDFIIKGIKDNALNISRRMGYLMLGAEGVNVYNIVRKLSGNHYPRFHVYLKQQGDHFHFSLHLDQKAPIYQGTHAHNGEYDGQVIEVEADRIKQIFM